MSDIVFPKLVSSNWKLTRAPFFKTMAQESVSGKYTTAALQSGVLWKWTLKNGILQSKCSIRDLQAVEGLFISMMGMYDSFLWPDPEPCSITPGYINYYPCKFLSDSLDFDRLAYKIWELGEVSFRQVAPPILVVTPDCCVGTGDNATDNDASTVITSAVLSITTSFTQASTYTADAAINFNGVGLTSLFGADAMRSTGHNKRTDTFTLNATSLADLVVQNAFFYIDGSLSGTGDSQFNIYDANVAVTYSDGTSALYRASTINTSINSGTITGAANAADSDATSAAIIERATFAPLATSSVLQLSNFTAS